MIKKSKKKLPWMPFYAKDWLGDTRCLTTRQKGIWIDLLAYMWMAKPRGRISGQWEDIARMVGEPGVECETEIVQIHRKNVLELSQCNGIVTLVSRRMIKDEKARESTRSRVNNFRKSHSNGDVTRMKQGEVRSQKAYNYLPEAANKVVDKSDPAKAETGVQVVVKGWKQLVGVPIEGPESAGWDKVHFPRHAKAAKALLDLFGAPGAALEATRYVYKHLTSQNLTCTLETVVKHSDLYRSSRAAVPGPSQAVQTAAAAKFEAFKRKLGVIEFKPRSESESVPDSGVDTPSAT